MAIEQCNILEATGVSPASVGIGYDKTIAAFLPKR